MEKSLEQATAVNHFCASAESVHLCPATFNATPVDMMLLLRESSAQTFISTFYFQHETFELNLCNVLKKTLFAHLYSSLQN